MGSSILPLVKPVRAAGALVATLVVAGCVVPLPPEGSIKILPDAGGAPGLEDTPADGGAPDGASETFDAGPYATDAAEITPDAGGPASDAGMSEPDASTESDAGVSEHDAGGTADAGSPATDAGSPETDAGSPETDAGSPETDAGSPETDAGLPEIDAGLPEVDAGPKPVGSGCSTAADCASGTCYTNSPNGYCTQGCGSGCPTGSACDQALGGYCVQTCSANSDCRDGYTCQTYQLFSGKACLEAFCRFNFQCPGALVCNTTVGACFTSCTTDADCPDPSETCDTAHGFCGPS
jgi:hypothetical protein